MISLLLILAMCLGMTISVSAGDTGGFANEYCHVQDQAELMTYSEKAELNDMLDELSVRQKMEVVVVTTNTLDGKTAEEYADDTYDYGNFGYGADKDGILLLVSVGEENICCISTCGYGITAFTDDGIEYILKEMKGDLHDEKYFAAFQTFVNLCDKFITQARSGGTFWRKKSSKRTIIADLDPDFPWSRSCSVAYYRRQDESAAENGAFPDDGRQLCKRRQSGYYRKQRYVPV